MKWISIISLLFALLILSPSVSWAIKKKKYSERDLADLEDQWAEDENDFDPSDPTRWHKDDSGRKVPPTDSSQKKSEMAFVSLKKPISKRQSSEWAGKQADILSSGGVAVKAYPVEAGKILFVCENGILDMLKVRHFILKQRSSVVDFEWQQKKVEPRLLLPGQTEEELDEELDAEEQDRLDKLADQILVEEQTLRSELEERNETWSDQQVNDTVSERLACQGVAVETLKIGANGVVLNEIEEKVALLVSEADTMAKVREILSANVFVSSRPAQTESRRAEWGAYCEEEENECEDDC